MKTTKNQQESLWKKSEVEASHAYHVVDDEPLYQQRFHEVLPFHPPGIAPVQDESGAYHITAHSKPPYQPLYQERYHRTFGYYQEAAVVVAEKNTRNESHPLCEQNTKYHWFHIGIHGSPLYAQTYLWCGNYQSGYALVCDCNNRYFHIDKHGKKAYAQTWSYAGDFKEGYAVVQNDQGLHSHIKKDGQLLHETWYIDLDVFHKGLARAKDEQGWAHVTTLGFFAYHRRFANVEPFYNGFARVETFDGQLEIIDEQGDTVRVLRAPRISNFTKLSNDLVGFWKTDAIYSAVVLQVFEFLPSSAKEIAQKLGLDLDKLERLLRAMGELDLVAKDYDTKDDWMLTAKGQYLRKDHPQTLRDAAIEYAVYFRESWKDLSTQIKKSQNLENMADNSSKAQENNIFLQVAHSPSRLESHHRMLDSYAQHDYASIAPELPIQDHMVVVDIGGGLGFLAKSIKELHPQAQLYILELPQVCAHASTLTKEETVSFIAGDFFKPFPSALPKADVIILSRVLHDWNDQQAQVILKNAKEVLKEDGCVVVLETVLEQYSYNAGLLDMHMLASTGGQERSSVDYGALLHRVGLRIDKTKRLDGLSFLFIAYKWKNIRWIIPTATQNFLSSHRSVIPKDRAVVMLMRHSVRPFLATGTVGNTLALTAEGIELSQELGKLIQGQIRTAEASPTRRCIETAKYVLQGANQSLSVEENSLLGMPGVYSYGGIESGKVWQTRGHENVMKYMVAGTACWPGLPDPDFAARYLLQNLLREGKSKEKGIHLYVTHDSLVTATASRILGIPLYKDQWPQYLETAFFWEEDGYIRVAYKGYNQKGKSLPFCSLSKEDVLALAKREIATTIGLRCKARFYLVGGVFKSLLNGKPPHDLDLYAATEHDRQLLLQHLHLLDKKQKTHREKDYTDIFTLKGRDIEVKKFVKPTHATLEGVISGFDLVLASIGVEHRGFNKWNVYVHPQAWSSYTKGKVLLREDLQNPKHLCSTIVRLQCYAYELDLPTPQEQIQYVWNVFDSADKSFQQEMLKRFRKGARYNAALEQEILQRMK